MDGVADENVGRAIASECLTVASESYMNVSVIDDARSGFDMRRTRQHRNTAPRRDVAQPSQGGSVYRDSQKRSFSTMSPRSVISCVTGFDFSNVDPPQRTLTRGIATNCHEKHWPLYVDTTIPGVRGQKNADLVSTPAHPDLPSIVRMVSQHHQAHLDVNPAMSQQNVSDVDEKKRL